MEVNECKTKNEHSDGVVNKCSCHMTSYNLNYVNYPIMSVMGVLICSVIAFWGELSSLRDGKSEQNVYPMLAKCPSSQPLNTHPKNSRKENP
ncbi:hypothetical protein COL46_07560 [Bacillus toyonensis]|nr:hypothetical protein COL46_07560 [Bacillus toyonensis]